MSILHDLYETIDLNLVPYQDRTKRPILWDSRPKNLSQETDFFSGRIRVWTEPELSTTNAQFVIDQVYKNLSGVLEISYQIHDSYVDFDYQIREPKRIGEN
ncbi:hypothetical protein [Streptococcus anginosus]|uniref:hypothetical protein n=1 Tax=Streptococcus anginosus TaxID=1328 RepID=UPI00195C6C69|nr:hypothetical protein [Streptococcus anginosus]VTY27237.1 Uncharacterised protein [Streptococcus anginosus]